MFFCRQRTQTSKSIGRNALFLLVAISIIFVSIASMGCVGTKPGITTVTGINPTVTGTINATVPRADPETGLVNWIAAVNEGLPADV